MEGLLRLDEVGIALKCPFSIGVGVMTPFNDSLHPAEECVTRQGKKWCSNVWDCLVRKGQSMTIGSTVLRRSYVGAQPGQNVLVLPIFKSYLEEPNVKYDFMKCLGVKCQCNYEFCILCSW